jgi:hypothetical protein
MTQIFGLVQKFGQHDTRLVTMQWITDNLFLLNNVLSFFLSLKKKALLCDVGFFNIHHQRIFF